MRLVFVRRPVYYRAGALLVNGCGLAALVIPYLPDAFADSFLIVIVLECGLNREGLGTGVLDQGHVRH